MANKWFIQTGENIEGPFNTEDLQVRVHAQSLPANALIWGPGTDEWHTPQDWTNALAGLAPESKTGEDEPEAWHYAVGGQSHGPMPRAQLVSELKDLNGGEIMLWAKGMKEWAAIYEFHDLLNEIGINKRQYPRAELMGKAIIKVDGQSMIAPLLSISEGGFGVALEEGFVPGQMITAEIQSPSFPSSLSVSAETRYVGHGVIGFKFTQINSETRGAIIQFIKQNQVRFNIKAA